MRIVAAPGGNALLCRGETASPEAATWRRPLLTDAEAVHTDRDLLRARSLRPASPAALDEFGFVPGSMGPKVAAACEFARASVQGEGSWSLRRNVRSL